MSTDVDPIIGHWYEHTDKGYKFEVVGFDEEAGLVEIQFYDGNLDEIELDEWYEQELEVSEPPEDWTGPVDDVEVDDLDYTDTQMRPEDWSRPLQEYRDAPEAEQRPEDTDEDEPPPE